MKTLFKIGLLLLSTVMISEAMAQVVCHTPRMSKVFQIDQNKVAVYQNDVKDGREIASSNQARTLFTTTGFTKVLQHMGHKVTLHIENSKNFSELNDYLVIRDNQGHEITYPLTCYQK